MHLNHCQGDVRSREKAVRGFILSFLLMFSAGCGQAQDDGSVAIDINAHYRVAGLTTRIGNLAHFGQEQQFLAFDDFDQKTLVVVDLENGSYQSIDHEGVHVRSVQSCINCSTILVQFRRVEESIFSIINAEGEAFSFKRSLGGAMSATLDENWVYLIRSTSALSDYIVGDISTLQSIDTPKASQFAAYLTRIDIGSFEAGSSEAPNELPGVQFPEKFYGIGVSFLGEIAPGYFVVRSVSAVGLEQTDGNSQVLGERYPDPFNHFIIELGDDKIQSLVVSRCTDYGAVVSLDQSEGAMILRADNGDVIYCSERAGEAPVLDTISWMGDALVSDFPENLQCSIDFLARSRERLLQVCSNARREYVVRTCSPLGDHDYECVFSGIVRTGVL